MAADRDAAKTTLHEMDAFHYVYEEHERNHSTLQASTTDEDFCEAFIVYINSQPMLLPLKLEINSMEVWDALNKTATECIYRELQRVSRSTILPGDSRFFFRSIFPINEIAHSAEHIWVVIAH